jgi:putative transposase
VSEYRRAIIPGGVFFFTVVTYRRLPIFADPDNIGHLRDAFRKVRSKAPFDIDGIVVLPDHLHCIWQLPQGDGDYSGRWREIKKAVSRAIHPESNERRERPVWQRRFWEHAIRDEKDWRIHMDYIHYNPVKHGFVRTPLGMALVEFAEKYTERLVSGMLGPRGAC